MAKIIRLANGIDTPYRADKDFGQPETVRHPTPQGTFFEETIYLLKPGVEVEVPDDRAEFLRQTWGWRLEIRDK